MAKSSGSPSKAAQVRDYIQANSKLSGGEVQAYFAKKGITVASSEVSNARRALGLSKRRKRKGGRGEAEATTATATRGARKSGNPLSATVSFVQSVGGLKAARAALAQLEEIRSLAN